MTRILFTSPGRRVELIKIFLKYIQKGDLFGADYSSMSPANYFLNKVYKLPKKIDDVYVSETIRICKLETIDILIPLIDPEIPLFIKAQEQFAKSGTRLLIPQNEIVSFSNSKIETFNKMLALKDVNLPFTCIYEEYDRKKHNFNTDNLILKPNFGSSSDGIIKIEKKAASRYIKANYDSLANYLVQECIEYFHEVTVDVFGDGEGRIVELCQRKRLKVRGGEVEKGVTIRDERLSSMIERIVEKFKIFGVFNIQFMFCKRSNKYFLIEINPRFGGGYPLSHHAGSNFVENIIKYINKEDFAYYNDERYISDFFMLRYDQAIYTNELYKLC